MTSNSYIERPDIPLTGSSWHDLCKSDYAKVIFYDLYRKASKVGCRFQITDNVHEDPCDYIGLFKVGYKNLSQCLASKLLSDTECEEDGKLLRCSFKTDELPELDDGFYQFLYVTRDHEVCGASLPFEIRQPYNNESSSSSEEDVVADNGEDDFLLVRSNLAEKNKELQSIIDKMYLKNKSLESEMLNMEERIELVMEGKNKLQKEFKALAEENNNILIKYQNEVQDNKHLSLELRAMKKCVDKYVSEGNKLEEDLQLLLIERDETSAKHRIEIEVKTAALKEAEEKIQSLEKQINDLTTTLKEANKELRESEKVKHVQKTTIDRLTVINNELTADKLELKQTIKKLTSFETCDKQMYTNRKEFEERTSEAIRQFAELNNIRLLKSQLEDAEHMVTALTESKQLVMDEMYLLLNTVNDLKEKLKETKCENFSLNLKLTDLETECEKLKENLKDVKCVNFALKLQLSDSESANEQYKKQALSMEKDVSPLKLNFEDSQSTQEISGCKAKHFSKKREPKKKEKKALLKHQIRQLEAEIQEKHRTLAELQEKCNTKDALIDFLRKDMDRAHKINVSLNTALKDALSRLDEAADIYKKQFIEIEKYKRKLKKRSKSNSQGNDSFETLSVPDSTTSEVKGDTVINNMDIPLNHINDSDTGEHTGVSKMKCENGIPVMPPTLKFLSEEAKPCNNNLPVIEVEDLEKETHKFPSYASSSATDSSKNNERLSPELETMIEKNLASLTSSKADKIEGEEMYSIPCPVCEQDIGIFLSSSDEMVKHLEMQHKQQICPICGRLFDMTLHSKYFQFHIEDHFVNGSTM